MSTILKALRRLEEDNSIDASTSSTPPSSSGSLPATDPHATDELRVRILAEELAAEASAVDRVDPSTTRKRVLIVTAIAAATVTALVVGLGPGFYSTPTDGQTDAVVAVSPSPSPFAPSPSPSRAPTTSITPTISPFTSPPTSPSPVLPVPVALPTDQAPVAADPMEDQSTADTSVRIAAIPIVQSDSSRAKNSGRANPTASRSEKAAPSSQSPMRVTDEPTAPAPRQEMPLAAVVPTTASLESGSVTGTSASPRSGRSAPSGNISATQSKPQSKPRPTPTRAERRATNSEAAVSAAKSPSESTAEPEPRDRAKKSVKPEAAAVEEHKGLAIPDLTVLRTAWHPSPDRRSAKIRLLDTKETMTLKEGDAVGGLVIQEISPSAVLFRSGEIELRLRVGQPGSGS